MRHARPRDALWLTCVLLGGCGLQGARPDPVRYFQLTPVAGADGARAPAGRSITLGLGPISFPAYLDRVQMVTRVAPSELEVSPFDRWAEPLPQNFTRVLAENLSVLLATDRVVVYPWYASAAVDYRVEVEVIRFERRASSGDVELTARWSVRDGAKAVLFTTESTLVEPDGGADTEAVVTALSRVVGLFGRDIAAALERIPRAG